MCGLAPREFAGTLHASPLALVNHTAVVTRLAFLLRVCIVILLAFVAWGQSGESPPKFLGADVHASRHETVPQLGGPYTSAGLYKLRFATMVDLVRLAYDVEATRVVGGPDWLEFDRFDVVAKPPANTTPGQIRLMLQSLLQERFHLVAQIGTQPMRASALRVGQHLHLTESHGSAAAGCGGYSPPNPRPTPNTYLLRCHNMTMADLAEQVRNLNRQGRFRSPLPVVDQTGLQGSWDFEFQYDAQVAALDDNSYISQMLDKELGLKLDDVRIPAPVVEIRSVDRTPGPNSPDLAKVIPPVPAEFEAAEIKPADLSPGARAMFEFKNGRVFLPRYTAAALIRMGWDVGQIVGLPKWAESDLVDVVAKAPPEVSIETSSTNAGRVLLDLEPMMPMVRALVIDHYKLRAHTEDRPTPSYSLVAVKPKLAKPDPDTRLSWHEGPPLHAIDFKAGNPELGRLITCENMTMAQFAELLPQISEGEVHYPVLDATGIQGSWTFSFNVVATWRLNALAASRKKEGGDAASDPVPGYSIFDAIAKQLGLKLEPIKQPEPILVVDHIEQ